jgi:hypothetical protein
MQSAIEATERKAALAKAKAAAKKAKQAAKGPKDTSAAETYAIATEKKAKTLAEAEAAAAALAADKAEHKAMRDRMYATPEGRRAYEKMRQFAISQASTSYMNRCNLGTYTPQQLALRELAAKARLDAELARWN